MFWKINTFNVYKNDVLNLQRLRLKVFFLSIPFVGDAISSSTDDSSLTFVDSSEESVPSPSILDIVGINADFYQNLAYVEEVNIVRRED